MSDRDDVQMATTHSTDDLAAAWGRGTPVDIAPSETQPTSVLSVRMPREMLRELSEAARKDGKAPGTFARELLELALAMGDSSSPALVAQVLARLLALLPNPVVDAASWLSTQVHRPPGLLQPDQDVIQLLGGFAAKPMIRLAAPPEPLESSAWQWSDQPNPSPALKLVENS